MSPRCRALRGADALVGAADDAEDWRGRGTAAGRLVAEAARDLLSAEVLAQAQRCTPQLRPKDETAGIAALHGVIPLRAAAGVRGAGAPWSTSTTASRSSGSFSAGWATDHLLRTPHDPLPSTRLRFDRIARCTHEVDDDASRRAHGPRVVAGGQVGQSTGADLLQTVVVVGHPQLAGHHVHQVLHLAAVRPGDRPD